MIFVRILLALYSCCFIFTTNATSIDSINRGQSKAALCTGCHGLNGIGLSAEYPNLANQKSAYLIKQLKAFKEKKRINTTMNAMAQNLNENDIKDLAAFFSQVKFIKSKASTLVKINTVKASSKEFPHTIFVSMKDSASVIAFPSETSIAGGKNMLYTALTPDGKRLLSTSPSTNTLYIFDTLSMKQLTTIKVNKAPKGVKVSPDGKIAFVINQGANNISIIDMQHLTTIGNIATPTAPHNVRFTQSGKLAYVTLQGGAGIGVINVAQRILSKVIAVPNIIGPHNLDLSKDEKTLYVRDFVHHVAIVDLMLEKVEKVITVGNGHGGIDVFPNGKFVATAAIGDSFITVIDTQTLATKNIELGTASHGIRASKNSQWLYVTLPKENAIAVINTQTWQVDKKIAVGKFPFWIAVQGNP